MVKNYTTFLSDKSPKTVVTERFFEFDKNEEEMKIVNIYPSEEFQEIEGFGGAITEAAGYVFSKMPENLKQEFLNDYFSVNGLNYNFCRASIDSCDFSLENYSADNDPDDVELLKFSIERKRQT